MSKFFGPIGFANSEETFPGSGVWEDVITEKTYRGDVTRNLKRWDNGNGLNQNLNISNVISIVADPYFLEHLYSIKYVKWLGGYWAISSVEVQTPRLILNIGGVYNGPTAGTSESTDEYPRFE